MRFSTLAFLLGLAIATTPAQARTEDVAKLTAEAREAADSLLGMIRGELVRAMETSGPLRGIIACKYSVPEITSNLSRQKGWRISRVSLKPRNPALGEPDAWEQRALLNFEQRQARGDPASSLEFSEIVSEPAGPSFRFIRALTLQPLCMSCHGDNLTEAVKAQLDVEYPSDRAVGYKPGQVRGAITIKRPLR